jgi:ubiquitin-protein ligase
LNFLPLMSAPLLRRLEKEYRDLQLLREQSSMFTFSATGAPPAQYRVDLSCGGLCIVGSDAHIINAHRFDVVIGEEFPFVAPQIKWLSPIFHPNIKPPYVCLGDHWYPGWSIAEMCVAICEMVQYKRFNIYDPLQPAAAHWLRQLMEASPDAIPVDPRPVRDLDFHILGGTPHATGS